MAKIQHVQNSAARLITGSLKFDHITPVLTDLHWLPVNKRIEFKIILTTYKSLNGTGPGYITYLLELNTFGLRSGDDPMLLRKPRVRLLSYGQRAFSWAAPVLWNPLPSKLRMCSSVAAFRSKLKTFLFQQYFG